MSYHKIAQRCLIFIQITTVIVIYITLFLFLIYYQRHTMVPNSSRKYCFHVYTNKILLLSGKSMDDTWIVYIFMYSLKSETWSKT